MKSRLPKVLHRVCGKEMVGLVLDAARGAGIDSTVVVVSSDGRPIREALGDRVRYVIQKQQLGTGHAVLQALPAVETAEDIAVLSGDVPLILPETLQRMVSIHRQRDACITLLTTTLPDPTGLGRVVRDSSGDIVAVVEEVDADEGTRALKEVNGGVYLFRTSWLRPNLQSVAPSANGEVFLTDLISLASRQKKPVVSVEPQQSQEILGVDTRSLLASAEAALRDRLRQRWMLSGVTMVDPGSTFIDVDVSLGQDTVVLPNTHLTGATRVGRDCRIGPNSIVHDSDIGDGCSVVASVVEGSTLEAEVDVGPFSHIRPGSYLESGVHVGHSVEVKNSRLGRGTRSGHFSYIGDAEVGANVNIGAGTVTCNFDGVRKSRTNIGESAFIGSGSMLVAPVTIGPRSVTGAGAVVTRDVPPDTLAVGVPARPRPKRAPHQDDC